MIGRSLRTVYSQNTLFWEGLKILGTILALICTNVALGFDRQDLETVLNGGDCVGCDLSDAQLHKRNLSRLDLSSSNFSGADLSNANLRDAVLRNANLSFADLSGANLRRTSLEGPI